MKFVSNRNSFPAETLLHRLKNSCPLRYLLLLDVKPITWKTNILQCPPKKNVFALRGYIPEDNYTFTFVTQEQYIAKKKKNS